MKQRITTWRKNVLIVGVMLVAASGLSSLPAAAQETAVQTESGDTPTESIATFGGGCFWCVEAVFEKVNGVTDVVSGYAGGRRSNPTYEQVCTGLTGHAEVCQIKYDPSVVSFKELLEVFWKTHDPTTLNRQGPDKGTQYRSVVFYHDDEQKKLAEKYMKELDRSGAFESRIVTQIKRAPKFFPAEEYHQDFYRRNPNQSYCAAIVRPKVDKFMKAFEDKLTEDAKVGPR